MLAVIVKARSRKRAAIKTYKQIKAWVRQRITPCRYVHTIGVFETVGPLSERHGIDGSPLGLAALLHDCAREMTDQEMIAAAERWKLPVRTIDRDCPVLLHGKLAVEIARREHNLSDPVMQSAIVRHTAGHPEMTTADKIFFLADTIEPSRKFAGVEMIRSLAARDINKAMLLAVELSLAALRLQGVPIDPDSLMLLKVLKY